MIIKVYHYGTVAEIGVKSTSSNKVDVHLEKRNEVGKVIESGNVCLTKTEARTLATALVESTKELK